MLQLGGWFLIVPATIGVAVAMPGLAPQFGRLADIAAAIIALAVLAYVGFPDHPASHGHDTRHGGQQCRNAGLCQNYSQRLSIGVMPGVGLVVLAVNASLMILRAFRGAT